MESKKLGCINRDKNSVNNMIKLVNYYFEYKNIVIEKVRCQMISSSLKELDISV